MARFFGQFEKMSIHEQTPYKELLNLNHPQRTSPVLSEFLNNALLDKLRLVPKLCPFIVCVFGIILGICTDHTQYNVIGRIKSLYLSVRGF